MEQEFQAVRARTLGELLNETFVVYGSHFWRFIGLAAVVQVPVSLIALAITRVLGVGPAAFVLSASLSLFGVVLVYGGVVFAVGQHYVIGNIRIVGCYSRLWRRVASLTILALIVALSVAWGVALAVYVVPAVILLVFLIYRALAVPAVVVEGYRAVGALKRSFGLVRGSWWRVFGITLVALLASVGLALLLGAPFAVGSWLSGPGEPTALSDTLQFLGGVIAAILVPPLLAIVGTLLYYDLRVRKERYDVSTLSREIRTAAT